MVKTHQIKRQQELFKNNLTNSNKEGLSIKNFNLTDKSDYKGDLSRLISCSENYYEDLIKIIIDDEKVITIDNDSNLQISGSGLLYLIIEKDCNININFESENDSFIFIKILVKENINLELIDYSNSNKLYKYLSIVLENNTVLNHNQIIFNSNHNINITRLNKNSKYNLNSVYNINNSNLYLENKSFHIKENSNSNMQVKGVCTNKSNIINDGLIKIDSKATNVIAHQKLQNLILDDKSNVLTDPILEVENSKIQCSHSTSVSKIDEEIYFYLNSKGLNDNQINSLIIKGFLDEVIDNIKNNEFKTNIKSKINF